MARAGRRRRVLNEEVRAAGNVASTLVPHEEQDAQDSPRYGEQASIENHPQVTDFVPRKFGKVVALVVVGIAISGGMLAWDIHAAYLESLLPAGTQGVLTDYLSPKFSQGLIAWSSAMVFMAAGLYARLIFMLRRHRVDDDRGRYRVWRTASWLAILLSLNSVLAFQQPLGHFLGVVSGWHLLAGESGWWLGLSALVCGPVLLRLIIDMAESRAALTMALFAVSCYLVAGFSIAADWSPVLLGVWSPALTYSLPFTGHVLLLTAILLNARYVVLDAQGLLPLPAKRSIKSTAKVTDFDLESDVVKTERQPQIEKVAVEKTTTATTKKKTSPKPLAVVKETVAPQESNWINGVADDLDADDSQQQRRLSKSERKRLRKQKSSKAA